MNDIPIRELLPFVLPLILAELAVVGYTLYHILTHNTYKRGTRVLWILVTVLFMNTFIGPILYFILGKEDA